MAGQLIGTRIREARRTLGLTQRQLAADAGLSPSYLNLIEHNRRGIAGARLTALARALNLPPASLSEGPERALLAELQRAAGDGEAEAAQAEALAAQYPGWAQVLARLSRQGRDLREALAILTDRLNHDPFLAETLHAVLSNVTAIRSTAGILSTVDDIAPDQQRRFVRIIHDESRRLSDAATALSAYLDRAAEGKAAAATPEEALDQFLQSHGHAFPALDSGASVDTVLASADGLDSAAARQLARTVLRRYASDAAALPLATFLTTAQTSSWDPLALQAQFGGPLRQIFRRLAALRRDGIDAPRLGLLVVNAAGQPLWRQPLAEFPLPRHGAACTLWPLFQCFSQPGRPVLHRLILPDDTSCLALSIAEPAGPAQLDQPIRYQAAMLLIPAESAEQMQTWLSSAPPSIQIGTACTICPRSACPARSGAEFLAQAVASQD